jgi:hypothetical protein
MRHEMPAPRPSLVVTQPLSQMTTLIAHIAHVERWNIIRNVGGLLSSEVLDGEVCLYGDCQQVCGIAERNGLLLFAPDARWLCELPQEYLGRHLEIVSWSQARLMAQRCLVDLLYDENFTPAIYDDGASLPMDAGIPEDAETMVAALLAFEYEFRCFIVEGVVVAMSPYAHHGRSFQGREVRNVPEPLYEEALAFSEALLADPRVESPPAFVVDVGLEPNGSWRVVKVQPAWSSEPFGCSPQGVLESLKRSCTNRRKLRTADHRWIVYGTSRYAG